MLYNIRKSKTNIAPKILEEVLSEIGFSTLNVQNVNLSYTNDVYRVVNEREVYFLKFFTDQWCDRNAGVREIEAINLMNSIGVKAPIIEYFGKAKKEIPRNFAVFKALEGVPLIQTLARNLSDYFLNQSIALLKKLSGVEGNFGFFGHDKNVHRTYDTHFEFINDTVF